MRELIEKCGCISGATPGDPEITMVSTDSRKIERGGLFIAVEGYRDNGVRYIRDAVSRGASAVVMEEKQRDREIPEGENIEICYTESARLAALHLPRVLLEYPSSAFTLAGVTGTNGKTTVTYLLEAILRAWGGNPGVIGTISYRYNDIARKAHNTTPDPVEIQNLFAMMRSGGVTHAVMEVSSHALAMDRVYPPDFDYALFTNLSQDHLDFHGSMEDYFRAKLHLFRELDPGAAAVVNNDDDYGKKIAALARCRVVTYGMHPGCDFIALRPDLSIDGTSVEINEHPLRTSLVGVHNIYNILAATALGITMGVDWETAVRGLNGVTCIPGRFERVPVGRPFNVFVDYAHTPDALTHLLDTAVSLRKNRIITVFGCGGDRDRSKRPIMGRVVEERSDIVIVTSDNPRSEKPEAIISDIEKGLKGKDHIVLPDRREAIFRAVGLAHDEDIVLIAGKGHEDYQILGERTIHFDDREVAMEAAGAPG